MSQGVSLRRRIAQDRQRKNPALQAAHAGRSASETGLEPYLLQPRGICVPSGRELRRGFLAPRGFRTVPSERLNAEPSIRLRPPPPVAKVCRVSLARFS